MKNTEKDPKAFKYSIDNKPKESSEPIITGAEIRKEGAVPADYKIYLKVNGPGEDELIEDNKNVNLSEPGRDHFYSVKPNTGNG